MRTRYAFNTILLQKIRGKENLDKTLLASIIDVGFIFIFCYSIVRDRIKEYLHYIVHIKIKYSAER